MYLNRISIPGERMECPVMCVQRLSESALSGGPFALKKRLCLPTCVRRMILSDNGSIGRCSSLQALQHPRGCDTPDFSGRGTLKHVPLRRPAHTGAQ